jgi:fibronectin-binding autotransporter adhesin
MDSSNNAARSQARRCRPGISPEAAKRRGSAPRLRRVPRSIAVAAATAAAAVSVDLVVGPGTANAQSLVVGANYSAAVETSGPYVSTSFEAAGQNADTYPAFGAVAFNASSFTSFAADGVTTTATLTATEFVSSSASTLTHAGSVLNIYFAENPQTTGLGDYNTALEPGGFNASSFSADYVGSVTYSNVSNHVDTMSLTLSSADVTYIDTVLSNLSSGASAAGSGSFEFFAVATTNLSSGRYDGSYSGALATLTLNENIVAGQPSGFLTFDPAGTGATGSPNLTTNAAVTDFKDSGTGGDVAFANGNTVTFNDPGSATTISIDPAGVAPASVTVNNSSGTYTFTGSGTTGITGSATLTKSGTGTLIINNSNSYTGATTVTGGTLSISSDANLGSTSTDAPLSLSNATLLTTASFTSGRAISFGGPSVTLNDGGNSIVFGGGVTGSSSTVLNKIGAGTVELDVPGTSGSIGSFNVSAGTLVLASTNSRATPYINFGSTTDIVNGTLTLGGGDNAFEAEIETPTTTTGTGTINVEPCTVIYPYYAGTATIATKIAVYSDGTGTSALGGGGTGRILNVTGNIVDGTGGPGVVYYGGSAASSGTGLTGKVFLSGTNTYTGGSFVVAGTAVANSSNAMGSGLVTVGEFTSGTSTVAGTLAGTGTISAPVSLTAAGTVTGGSGSTSNDSIGKLTLGGGLTATNAAFYVPKLNGTGATIDNNTVGASGIPGVQADELIILGSTTGITGLTINPVVITGGTFSVGGNYSFVIADAPANRNAFDALLASGAIAVGTSAAGQTDTLSVMPDGGSGEDLLLDVVVPTPEPTSLLLAGVAAAPLVLRRRRRERTSVPVA